MTKPASNPGIHLVEDFEPRSGTFRLGMKPLNTKSVKAAHGDPNRVIRVVARHLTREIRAEADMASGRILPHLTPNNYVLAGPANAHNIETVFKSQLTAAGVGMPVRRDCIMAIELVFSLPGDNNIDTRAYFSDCLAWAQDEFKPAPIISAIVHLDEACPHMHVLVAPIINSKMQGGKLFGYRAVFNRRNGHFHTTVAKKYGLARATPKLKLSAMARAAYAAKIVEEVAQNRLLLCGNPAARKVLSRLVAADPLPLGRALNLPPPSDGASDESQTVGEDAGAAVSTAAAPGRTAGNTGLPDESTSSLCYDVAGERFQPTAGQPINALVQRSVQIGGYEETRAAALTDNPTTVGNGGQQDQLARVDDHGFVYDHEDSHLASTWSEELGCHVEAPGLGTKNKAKADTAVAAALSQLATRRATPAAFTSHSLPDQEVEHDD